jgi:hypothetical protein
MTRRRRDESAARSAPETDAAGERVLAQGGPIDARLPDEIDQLRALPR